MILTDWPDIATVGDTRDAYRAAGNAAISANKSVTAILARSMGNFTVLAALIASFNSETLFAMNISGLRAPVAAISVAFAANVPSTSPIGIPIPQRIRSCKETRR